MDEKTTPSTEPINNATPDLKDAIRSIDAIGEDGSNPGVEDDRE